MCVKYRIKETKEVKKKNPRADNSRLQNLHFITRLAEPREVVSSYESCYFSTGRVEFQKKKKCLDVLVACSYIHL